MKPILTITGSDSTGASGVQADINTITELGGNAMAAITSITVQTTLGIQQFYDIPAEIVEGQIDAVMNDFAPDVVKIGLIRTQETLQAVVSSIMKYRPCHVVFDAVTYSSHGELLISRGIKETMAEKLLPLCTVIIQKDERFMHGMSNRFTSAVAVYLNKGCSVEEAKSKAKAYINAQTVRPSELQGRSSELYNEFIDAVSDHHREANGVYFYATLLNVSSRYLAQVTRRICGKSPKTIIDDYLIHEIELQLKFTNSTVQEIANRYGFSSQAHFTKFFKKIKGISPTKFRRNETRQTEIE